MCRRAWGFTRDAFKAVTVFNKGLCAENDSKTSGLFDLFLDSVFLWPLLLFFFFTLAARVCFTKLKILVFIPSRQNFFDQIDATTDPHNKTQVSVL